jgi:hypothetical protein
LSEFFAGNAAAKGSPDYYGIAVSRVCRSGSAIKLDFTLTFKRGRRYCCFEDGCHHGLFQKASWKRLRRILRREGWTVPTPLEIALRGRVRKGARANYGGLTDAEKALVRTPYEYRAGPYLEKKATK